MKGISAIKDMWLVAASVTAILASGCSVDVKSDPVSIPPPRDEVLEAKSTIVGKWASNCVPADGAPGIFATVTLVFDTVPVGGDKGKLSTTGQAFSDSGCTVSLGNAETGVGNYQISGKSTTVGGAFDFQTTLPDGVGGWETIYDIMAVQNGLLYFSTDGVVDAKKRPTQLNFNMPYHRVQ